MGLRMALIGMLAATACAPVLVDVTAPDPTTAMAGGAHGECRRPASNTDCDRISSALMPGAMNPQGRWALGWQAAAGAPVELYESFTLNQNGLPSGEGIAVWRQRAADWPAAALNPTCHPYADRGTRMNPGEVVLTPGGAGQYSVVRWTPGHSGAVHIRAVFSSARGDSERPNLSTDIHVRRGPVELSAGKSDVGASAGSGKTFVYDNRIPLGVGDVLDFAVGAADGKGSPARDGTGVDIEICY
jgi:hypothetical protein